MQITTGLVTINSLTPTLVEGNASVDWTQVQVGNLFICDNRTFQITSVDAINQELTISPAWPSSIGFPSNSAYVIVRDYSLNFGIPLLNPGDLEAAAIWSRAIETIDAFLGTAGSTANEVTISVGSPTTFLVGNLIGFSASGWHLCRIDDVAKQVPIGMVTFVAVDGLSFKIKTEGRITGIAGITLTSGNKYYIRNTPVSGGGQLVNLTSVLGEAGNVLVPVFIADSSSSGYLLNLAVSQGAIFTATTNGLVRARELDPGWPFTAATRYLRDDGTWQPLTSTNISSTDFLKTGTVQWTNFVAGSPGLSVYNHIIDLHNRATAIENNNSQTAYVRLQYSFINAGAGTYSVPVPAGVKSAVVTVISVAIPKGERINATTFVYERTKAIVTRALLTGLAGDTISGVLGTCLTSSGHPTDSTATTLLKGATQLISCHSIIGPDRANAYPTLHADVINGEFRVFEMSPEDIDRLLYPISAPTLGGAAYTRFDSNQLTRVGSKGIVIIEWGNGSALGL